MLPRNVGESWIELYHHLLKLRERLTFDQLVGRSVEYRGGDEAAVQGKRNDGWPQRSQAICGNIMRAGKHWVTFTSPSSFKVYQTVGVIRPLPGWQKRGLDEFSPLLSEHHADFLRERTDRWEGIVHYCRLSIRIGHFVWSDWMGGGARKSNWEGRADYERDCSTIGMLLDLDEGKLSVYSNGRRLGTLKDGLAGEYCWIAGFWGEGDVSIQRGYELG